MPHISNALICNINILAYLYNNQIEGSIPTELGNLTNLEECFLNYNQLSGQISEEICNIENAIITLYGNNLCPEYPDCLNEEIIGNQNTSNCP